MARTSSLTLSNSNQPYIDGGDGRPSLQLAVRRVSVFAIITDATFSHGPVTAVALERQPTGRSGEGHVSMV